MSGPRMAQVVGAEFPEAQNIPPQNFDAVPHRPHRHHLTGVLSLGIMDVVYGSA